MRNDVGPRQRPLHPRHPPALHRLHRRAQDQAHPAQRQRAAAHRHPAGRHRLPQRLSRVRRTSEDKIALFCDVDKRGGHPAAHRAEHLRGAADPGGGGPGRLHRRAARPARRRARPERVAASWWTGCIKRPASRVDVALVGKYVELQDAYYLGAGGAQPRRPLPRPWPSNIELGALRGPGEAGRREPSCSAVQGIVVPGGFGDRGIEGMIDGRPLSPGQQQYPLPGPVPGHAGDGHRVRRATSSAAMRPTPPSSTPRRRTRSST